jgi:hypothetical protein
MAVSMVTAAKHVVRLTLSRGVVIIFTGGM